jgi:predicted membrane protein
MENKPSFRLSSQAIVGVAAILLGLIFLFDNMDMIDGRAYVRFWPVVLIAVGALRFVQPRHGGGGRLFSVALIAAGIIILLNNLHVTDISFRELWPLVLVLVGASMVFGHTALSRAAAGDGSPADANSVVNGFAVLGGFQRSNNSQDFRGGELTAVMGGCEIDLRRAAIAGNEAVITTFALWGGIKIKVPENWSVNIQGFPFLGGFDDRSVQPADPAAKRLVIRGSAVMGGVEIVN